MVIPEPAAAISEPAAAISEPAAEGEPEVAGAVTTPQPTEQPPPSESQASFLAAVGSTLTLGTGSTGLGVLVGLLLLVAIGYAIYYLLVQRRRRKSR